MKIHTEDFRVKESDEVNLERWSTHVHPVFDSRKDYDKLLQGHVSQLSELQQLHYASNRHTLLLIFQTMDAAGKDGAIGHVMSGVSPRGCQVSRFRHPTATEIEYAFLWRSTRNLPERDKIGIINRSYYEEVLIIHVYPELLRGEALVDPTSNDKPFWHQRYRSITNMEPHLHANGTRIVKFFLDLSKEEQCMHLLAPIDEPDKNWKFSTADTKEREFWKHYMRAYEECLSATSTNDSPWYVVPADDKKNAPLIVSQIVLNRFGELKMSYPKRSAERGRELPSIRKQLVS